ncbi:ferrous iron transport protein B [Olsenella massiliensis]|uniref:ferrous iron transport protein B n=1 Tax=Olsenella massiliensis TaxID=1622075 RepID=UPI00071D3A84|nr:ferrous iron transport protein B [Olsenella massiliensis]
MEAGKTLRDLRPNEVATVVRVGGDGALRQHFLDMGIIPGARVRFVKRAPLGDPLEFLLHGYELTLRAADAGRIEVSAVAATSTSGRASSSLGPAPGPTRHPGLGESGRSRDEDARTSDHTHALSATTRLTFALAGNQNCGKTTLFNQLTGANQHVGNFPGVTVDRKSGPIRSCDGAEVVDLPGIYSMSPYSAEELVSRRFILEERPEGIINIVDSTNIDRNLYLTMQLMELDRPLVLALNMMDELQGNGGSVDVNRLEDLLGIPVVPIAAIRGEGVEELVSHALHVARYQERPGRQDFCSPADHGGAVHRCLHAVMHLVQDHAERAGVPLRFAATKLVEGDALVEEKLALGAGERQAIEAIVRNMEAERGLDRAAAIADMRYSFIERVVAQCVVKPRVSRERTRSAAIDRVLTGRWTAVPAFALIMLSVFVLTFDVVGPFLSGLVEGLVGWATSAVAAGLVALGAGPVTRSLVMDGVLSAVGTILPIAPVIVTMFLFLSLLEDTGYMARVAFVMDKPLRRLGLSGRSIVPLLVGFGCSVPAVMATRTLPSERDRKLTVLLVPFMSCSTKLTIYAYVAAAFFPGYGGLVMSSLYALGILAGIVTALVCHATVARGEAVPFVMELPNYRMPSIRSMVQLVWDKTRDFLGRAFSVVFVAAVAIWVLQTFGPDLSMVADPRDSILALLASWMSPVFAPLGFADWRIVTSLIAGFMAKEVVVSTLGVLFGTTAGLAAALTPAAALALLTFCLLYTPCVAAIASIRRELGGRWALGVVAFQCAVAWLVALLVRLAGLGLGLG